MTRVYVTGGDEIDGQKDRPGSSNRRQPAKKPKLTTTALAPPPPTPSPVVLPPDDFEEEEDDSEDAESNDEDEDSVQQVNEETSNGGSLTLTLTDPDLLDCSNCLDSLKPPIFQCGKAHILCSSCRYEDMSICPQCQCLAVFDRCWVLEKIIDASRVACKNSIYGCKSMMKYHDKGVHERLCSYSPCSCPVYSCDFVDSTLNLYNHFGSKHAAVARNFRFSCPFVASLMRHLYLREETLGTIFALYHSTVRQGSAISIVQIAPETSSRKYRCELKIKDGEASLTLQSPVECVPTLDYYPDRRPTKHFLVVEDFHRRPLECVTLDIVIWYDEA